MQNQPSQVPKELKSLLRLREFLSFMPCIAAHGYIGLTYGAIFPISELELSWPITLAIFLISMTFAILLAKILHFLFQVMLRNLYYDRCAQVVHITLSRSWHAKSITQRTELIRQKLGSNYLYEQDPGDLRYSCILTLTNMVAFLANIPVISACLRIIVVISVIAISATCILYNLIGLIVTRPQKA